MYIGIDIGGSKILVAGADSNLKLGRQRKAASSPDQAVALGQIYDLVQEVSLGRRITAIGVAAPGPLDFKHGVMLAPPNLSWRNFSVIAALKERFGVPVAIENDANAAGLAETTAGAGQSAKVVLYVTISTGIGTGLIVDGVAYRGAGDAEGGHITINPGGAQCGCGGRGHFEAVVSGRAIERRFGRPAYAIKDKPTWDLIAHDMAVGLASLISATAPNVVVLGGGVSVHWQRFKHPLTRHLKTYMAQLYPPPIVRKAHYVETAAVRGALLIAKQTVDGRRI